MIQRKQSVFLFLAAVSLCIAACFNTGTVLMLVLLIVAALVSVGAIFLYKDRKRQAQVVLANMLLPVAWYVLLAVLNHTLQGTYLLVWADVLPAVAILFLFFARKGIQSDEKLVRSLDRIR